MVFVDVVNIKRNNFIKIFRKAPQSFYCIERKAVLSFILITLLVQLVLVESEGLNSTKTHGDAKES